MSGTQIVEPPIVIADETFSDADLKAVATEWTLRLKNCEREKFRLKEVIQRCNHMLQLELERRSRLDFEFMSIKEQLNRSITEQKRLEEMLNANERSTPESELMQKITSLQSEVNILTDQLNHERQSSIILHEEKKALEKNLKETSGQMNDVSTNLQMERNTLFGLRAENDSLSQSLHQLSEQSRELAEQLNSERQENTHCRDILELLRRENEQLMCKINKQDTDTQILAPIDSELRQRVCYDAGVQYSDIDEASESALNVDVVSTTDSEATFSVERAQWKAQLDIALLELTNTKELFNLSENKIGVLEKLNADIDDENMELKKHLHELATKINQKDKSSAICNEQSIQTDPIDSNSIGTQVLLVTVKVSDEKPANTLDVDMKPIEDILDFENETSQPSENDAMLHEAEINEELVVENERLKRQMLADRKELAETKKLLDDTRCDLKRLVAELDPLKRRLSSMETARSTSCNVCNGIDVDEIVKEILRMFTDCLEDARQAYFFSYNQFEQFKREQTSTEERVERYQKLLTTLNEAYLKNESVGDSSHHISFLLGEILRYKNQAKS